MTEVCKCIDISHWQDFPDFEEVRAEGVIAMIHKCTEGTGYVDPNRTTNIINARAAGITCATYHWIKPGNNGPDEMQFYLNVLDPVEGERVVIDYEESGCNLDNLIEAVRYLKADKRNLKVTVYSGHLLKEQLGSSHNAYLAENTDLWLAQYTSGEPSWPSGTYDHWKLWQYSESGSIEGIYGSEVDLNRYDGSDAELIKWISPAGLAPPVPEPVPPRPSAEVVWIHVNVPLDVRVKVKIHERRERGRARRGPDIPAR